MDLVTENELSSDTFDIKNPIKQIKNKYHTKKEHLKKDIKSKSIENAKETKKIKRKRKSKRNQINNEKLPSSESEDLDDFFIPLKNTHNDYSSNSKNECILFGTNKSSNNKES